MNRLDATLKVNDDLKKILQETGDKNKILKGKLNQEKDGRKQDFEDSLVCEEKAVKEIKSLELQIKHFEKNIRDLQDEVHSKNEIIRVQNSDFQKIKIEMTRKADIKREIENSRYITPKNPAKHSSTQLTWRPIHTENKYSALYQEAPSLHSTEETPDKSKNTSRRLIVIADSQGRDLHSHLDCLKMNLRYSHIRLPVQK